MVEGYRCWGDYKRPPNKCRKCKGEKLCTCSATAICKDMLILGKRDSGMAKACCDACDEKNDRSIRAAISGVRHKAVDENHPRSCVGACVTFIPNARCTTLEYAACVKMKTEKKNETSKEVTLCEDNRKVVAHVRKASKICGSKPNACRNVVPWCDIRRL